MKSLFFIKLLIYLFFLTNMENTKNRFLNYENYTENQVYLPYELEPVESKNIVKDSVLVNIQTMLNFKDDMQIKNDMFNMLLNKDVINSLNQYNYFNRTPHGYKNLKEYIEDRKQALKLYYLGSLRISKNFDSYLILVVNYRIEDMFNTDRIVILMNTQNTQLMSLTEISSYLCYNGHCYHSYTNILNDGTFNLMFKTVSTDVVIIDETGEIIDIKDERLLVEFLFDNQGYL